MTTTSMRRRRPRRISSRTAGIGCMPERGSKRTAASREYWATNWIDSSRSLPFQPRSRAATYYSLGLHSPGSPALEFPTPLFIRLRMALGPGSLAPEPSTGAGHWTTTCHQRESILAPSLRLTLEYNRQPQTFSTDSCLCPGYSYQPDSKRSDNP